MIRVKLHPYFQDLAGNKEIVQAEGKTVIEVIDDLERQFPGMKEQLVDGRGRVQGFAELFVNAEIVHPESTYMPINDGDELEVLVIVSGG